MTRTQAIAAALVFSHLFLVAQPAACANAMDDAAREVARNAATYAGRDAITLTFRNLSSLAALRAGPAQRALEAALREAGVRIATGAAAVEVHATLAEIPGRYLLVAEARRGDDRQVWMAWWQRGSAEASGATGATLDKRLLIELDEPILDASPVPGGLLVLTPARLALYDEGRREVRVAAIPAGRRARDPRGRLMTAGGDLHAYLPGLGCAGAWQPALELTCTAGDEPWPLDPAARLLARFTAGRNYFDGRVGTAGGLRRSVPPFYSAAALDRPAGAGWLLAAVDGHFYELDESLGLAGGPMDFAWGSDVASLVTPCGSRQPILTTRAGDTAEAIEAFALDGERAEPMSAALPMPGPVTALWPLGGSSAVAVVRNAGTGRYAAYLLTLTCTQ